MELSEEKLKQAMSRVDPPEGFAARVMARVEAQPPLASKPSANVHSPWWEWWRRLTAHPVPAGAMVLMVVVGLGVGLGHRWRQPSVSVSEQQRLAGEQAKAQLLLALEITGTRLSRMNALLSPQAPGILAPDGGQFRQ